jgi:uncharacterized protein (TIGR00255 family)
MTGFGDASEQAAGAHYVAEVRSLNNRYFKATIRLPEIISGLEAELESLLRRRLNRGSITLIVKMRAAEGSTTHRINDAALLDYLDHLETIHEKIGGDKGRGGDQAVHIDLTALLALPGVLVPEDEAAVLERARPVVLRLAEQACDKLALMRSREGEAIAEDLKRHRSFILERLAIVQSRAPQVVEEYHQRLRTRIDHLLARAELKIDEKDLIREVAIFAERADIAEEVTRLSGHLEEVERIVAARDGEPAGRTLDFLAQELLREANTIGSKSNDAAIARAVVEVKGAIDRIKEQVQNVE